MTPRAITAALQNCMGFACLQHPHQDDIVAAVLGLLNDCDMLAPREKPQHLEEQPDGTITPVESCPASHVCDCREDGVACQRAAPKPAAPQADQLVKITFNHSAPVRIEVSGVVLYEVDLSPLPYWQVCWAYGWSGSYETEDDAVAECLNFCGHYRSVRQVNPGDAGYENPNPPALTEKQVTIPAAPQPAAPQPLQADLDAMRPAFEKGRNDSHGFRRSRRGTYVNPQIARDWRAFCDGVRVARA